MGSFFKKIIEESEYKNLNKRGAMIVCEDSRITISASDKVNLSYDRISDHAENTLIFVLESPHIYEFQTNPPKPAQGQTGRNIARYFDEILSQIYTMTNDHSKYDQVILMNAIQYQCSLSLRLNQKANRLIRDNVFKEAWSDSSIGVNDFKSRLSKYLRPLQKAIIVNACTISDSKIVPERKVSVTHAILEVIASSSDKKIDLFQISHPSSWHYGEHRRTLTRGRIKTV